MKNKLKFIIPIVIAVIAIIVAALCIDFKPAEKVDISSLMSTAQKYLVEQDYEQAIAEFKKIIDLDPMNADAYLGLAEAYIGMDDTDSAVEWLEKGYELTGDERLKEILDKLLLPVMEETTVTTTAAAVETITASTAAMVIVPDLSGLSEEEAIAACEAAGLQYSVSYDYSDVVEKGYVLSQLIPVNASVTEEISVSFTVSKGAEAVTSATTTTADITTTTTVTITTTVTTTTAVTTTVAESTTVTTVPETTKPKGEDFITIKGKQYSTSLTELDLSNMKLTDEDIKPLEKMVNLIKLDLFKNQISDISPLNGLTNLTTLNLGSNQISDISSLSGLINLTYLSLSNNQISDISALSGLTNLKKLHLAYNGKIGGLDALKKALPDCYITTYMI